jgi:hypothetical protein
LKPNGAMRRILIPSLKARKRYGRHAASRKWTGSSAITHEPAFVF